jgi:hypothetical protein
VTVISSAQIPIELRRELIRRARDKKLRLVEFTSEEPTVWNPTQVINPECGIPFTDISAWHFIADQLEGGCLIEPIVLEKPPGETAYFIRVPGAMGQPRIYAKVRLHKQKIIGRSFHNDTRGER